jgi:hypothetical protein
LKEGFGGHKKGPKGITLQISQLSNLYSPYGTMEKSLNIGGVPSSLIFLLGKKNICKLSLKSDGAVNRSSHL